MGLARLISTGAPVEINDVLRVSELSFPRPVAQILSSVITTAGSTFPGTLWVRDFESRQGGSWGTHSTRKNGPKGNLRCPGTRPKGG